MIPFTWDWVEPTVAAACSIPNSPADIVLLHEHGIRAILSVNRRPLVCHAEVTEEFLTGLGIWHRHTPIQDGGVPDQVQIGEVLAFMLKARGEGRPFAVHCRWGIARTGVVLWLYYRAQGWTRDSITPFLRSRRKSFDSDTRLGPSNPAQLAFCEGRLV